MGRAFAGAFFLPLIFSSQFLREFLISVHFPESRASHAFQRGTPCGAYCWVRRKNWFFTTVSPSRWIARHIAEVNCCSGLYGSHELLLQFLHRLRVAQRCAGVLRIQREGLLVERCGGF